GVRFPSSPPSPSAFLLSSRPLLAPRALLLLLTAIQTLEMRSRPPLRLRWLLVVLLPSPSSS
ncbi:hypothetical protein BGZ96_003286, partial [Linnemannia gamsii]